MSIITVEFEVNPTDRRKNEVLVTVEQVGCVNVEHFVRGKVSVNSMKTPYSIAAQKWFDANRPLPWEVGDRVPRGEVLGVKWTARPVKGEPYPVNIAETGSLHRGAIILWIEAEDDLF